MQFWKKSYSILTKIYFPRTILQGSPALGREIWRKIIGVTKTKEPYIMNWRQGMTRKCSPFMSISHLMWREWMKRIIFLLANQLSTRTYLNLTPLLMALLIMSIMKSVFFLEYSLIRSCKDSFSLRFFVKRSLSSLMDIPKFPFLSFSPRMTKSRICWDLPSVIARNRVLNPRMQRFCTWEYTLPMFSVRLPFLG